MSLASLGRNSLTVQHCNRLFLLWLVGAQGRCSNQAKPPNSKADSDVQQEMLCPAGDALRDAGGRSYYPVQNPKGMKSASLFLYIFIQVILT